MSYYQLRAEQYLKLNPEKAWEFLSDPANLAKITPPQMHFQILESDGEPMYAGQIIHYKVSPLKGIKTHWVTEITQVEAGKYFIDEQRYGPYSMWHHQHHIEAVEGGVCMRDIINYKLPLGPLGKMAHVLFVGQQLRSIFRFREKALDEKFGNLPGRPNTLLFKKI
jgi:ligand-binding SRPBCC domain-containing protein